MTGQLCMSSTSADRVTRFGQQLRRVCTNCCCQIRIKSDFKRDHRRRHRRGGGVDCWSCLRLAPTKALQIQICHQKCGEPSPFKLSLHQLVAPSVPPSVFSFLQPSFPRLPPSPPPFFARAQVFFPGRGLIFLISFPPFPHSMLALALSFSFLPTFIPSSLTFSSPDQLLAKLPVLIVTILLRLSSSCHTFFSFLSFSLVYSSALSRFSSLFIV
jgi:hypothetical protein